VMLCFLVLAGNWACQWRHASGEQQYV